MWTALVLVWISSLSLSESLVPIKDARHSVLNKTDNPDEKDASVMTVTRVLHGTSETMTAVTPSPVPLATASPAANASSPSVTAGRTLRTDDAGTEDAPDPVASRAPLPPASAAAGRTPSSATVRVPRVQEPSGSLLPGTATLTTLATSAQPAAGTTAGARSPSQHAPGNPTASPTPPSGPQAPNVSTQAPAIQASAARPTAGTASGPMPTLSNSTSEPTRPPVASTAPAATIAVTRTTAPAQEPTTSTASAPRSSPTPKGEATSPTTRPSPAPSTWGTAGPGTARRPEQVLPETSPGPASTAPAPGSPGGSKMPPTALCPLSSQGQYLVVTAKPLTPSLVSRGFLLAVLLLGVTLFIIVLVLLALQAYESYRKKEYTQVDYLINGMYADSEL
ncbi:uncharacterized protein C11orf24 homolog [Neomonachus schauinslandi]|uniref:Uncharacterized protein C11orf24 homolog n=1 Tax=Neomonachus schauinslandi TaxID=29088 RepID=A0A8M1MNH8_NEOSC|nr:uncharacterized protein C11orf24 homolog [Neomonachus schauinslandi]XP_044775406.1 uncharacterized protein C11orf24 homolog [Neomonachus schauinslandi]